MGPGVPGARSIAGSPLYWLGDFGHVPLMFLTCKCGGKHKGYENQLSRECQLLLFASNQRYVFPLHLFLYFVALTLISFPFQSNFISYSDLSLLLFSKLEESSLPLFNRGQVGSQRTVPCSFGHFV